MSICFLRRLFSGVVFQLLSALLLLAHNASSAAKEKLHAQASAPSLDQIRIHKIYSDGDFEKVTAAIDSFTRANNTYGLSDSIFIAKHLAVIYTANPATREKGKSYMFRLLNLVPSAKIVDMFVSDEIDHIFEKVREEYVVHQQAIGQEKPTKLESNQFASDKMTMKANDPAPVSDQGRPAEKSASHQTFYWVAGGMTLVAVTGTAYYMLQPKKTVDKNYDVPK